MLYNYSNKKKNSIKKQNGYKNKQNSKKVVTSKMLGGEEGNVTVGVEDYDNDLSNNGRYAGHFLEDRNGNIERSGHGEMMYDTNDEYVGDWSEDKKNGPGMMKYGNGDMYVGNWSEDKKNGHGLMKYGNGDRYVGGWHNNERFNSGRITYKNGDNYVGNWSYNLKEGQGEMKYKNGDVYNGNWNQDKRDGQGTIKYANNNPSYTGLWSNDRISTRVGYTSDSDSVESNDSNYRDESDDDYDSPELTSIPIGNSGNTPIGKMKTNNFEQFIPKAFNPLNPFDLESLIEIMNENPNLIAFKSGDTIVTIEKSTLENMVDVNNPRNSVFYECLEIDPVFWERDEDFIKKDPLLNLRSININNGGYIRIEFILDAINGKNRYFLLYEPKKKILKSLVSDSVLKTGNIVSGSHCQEGLEGRLFEMKYIKDFGYKATKIQRTFRKYKTNKKGGNKRKKSVKKNRIK
jgi:hypothetical protein